MSEVALARDGEHHTERVRILVVEDEESYREALQAGLTKEGYDIELAADGPSGLARFAAHLPDLVLLDVLLPGMSGTEVCRRMRAIAPVPVIMVSALNTEIDVVLGLELGAADYVTKPYRMRELVARIQAVLRRVSPPGQVRTRDELIDRLWSGRDLADTRTLDTHVRRLRVKLERDPARPQYLVTVRGVGFRFDAEGRGEPELDDE